MILKSRLFYVVVFEIKTAENPFWLRKANENFYCKVPEKPNAKAFADKSNF